MRSRAILLLLLTPGPGWAQESRDPDSAMVVRLSAQMTYHFSVLAAAEWRRYGTHLDFVPLTPRLPDELPELAHDGFATVFLEASDSGWSAVVLHDSLPGTACGTYVGNVAVANRPSTAPGEIACTGDKGRLVHPGPVSLQVMHILFASDPTLDAPPKIVGCPEVDLPKDLRQPLRHVRMISMIDPNGTVSPAPVRVLDAPSFRYAAAAIVVLEQCRWRPGYRDRLAVRTAVRLPDVLGRDILVGDSLP